MERTKNDLAMLQALPLEVKVRMTQNRIREWVCEFGTSGVYVSFSGGKDSTVLLHIVRQMYPDIEAVFVNTGLEYPEIQKFVRTFDNVTILRPKIRFDEVIKKYGYPLISKEVSQDIFAARRNPKSRAATKFDENSEYVKKYGTRYCLSKWKPLLECDFYMSNMCCGVMKKTPAKDFEKRTGKKPFLATMASESRFRETRWIQHGCNAFDSKRQISQPMSFWTEQDVLRYIKESDLRIASVYGDIVYEGKDGFEYSNCFADAVKLCTTGCSRTGCIFCAFGAHLEKGEGRFEMLKRTHPRQYEYCIGGGEYVNGVWQPSKDGLGMGHVFDVLNELYGDGFIRY